jgi:hypothetical protein
METKDEWRVDIVKHGGDWDWNIRDNQNITISPGRHIATVNKYLRDVEEVSNLIAAAPGLLESLSDMVNAAARVAETWEAGDLAGAVNELQIQTEYALQTIAKAKGQKG